MAKEQVTLLDDGSIEAKVFLHEYKKQYDITSVKVSADAFKKPIELRELIKLVNQTQGADKIFLPCCYETCIYTDVLDQVIQINYENPGESEDEETIDSLGKKHIVQVAKPGTNQGLRLLVPFQLRLRSNIQNKAKTYGITDLKGNLIVQKKPETFGQAHKENKEKFYRKY